MAKKALLGHKIRRLRRDLGLTQAQMARQLGISGSYLNLIEHNQRALTVPVLLKLGQLYDVDVQSFAADDDSRLATELVEVFGDTLFDDLDLPPGELEDLARAAPAACRSVLQLYRAYRGAKNLSQELAERLQAEGELFEGDDVAHQPADEVSEFLQEHANHFAELEECAARLRRDADLAHQELDKGLSGYLQSRLGVSVEVASGPGTGGAVRRFDPKRNRLVLSEVLAPRSRHFQLAHQIALLQFREVLDRYTASSTLGSPDSRVLARVALGNYFAGAVLMPYEAFLDAARSVRYDIERLGHRFRTSFEQVCHRLTTLGRPGQEGVPFHMIRVDIAGNISKRFSASGIRFARYGGACPRWNVFSAFLQPGFIRTQLSRMPDGTVFFCLARTVRKEGGGFHLPQSRFAIGLGCKLDHAPELVYADGVDLQNVEAAVPIGTSCRLCERMDCAQRAFPPMQHRLNIDENVRAVSFYVNRD